MSESDFFSITQDGTLCDGDGGIGLNEFLELMLGQVCSFQPKRKGHPYLKGTMITRTGRALAGILSRGRTVEPVRDSSFLCLRIPCVGGYAPSTGRSAEPSHFLRTAIRTRQVAVLGQL